MIICFTAFTATYVVVGGEKCLWVNILQCQSVAWDRGAYVAHLPRELALKAPPTRAAPNIKRLLNICLTANLWPLFSKEADAFLMQCADFTKHMHNERK